MSAKTYEVGAYWNQRKDAIYLQVFDYIVRVVGRDASRMLDVGSGNCQYLEWFDWIETRVSVDLKVPYASSTVRGIKGNIFEMNLGPRFDLVTCLQVLEHVPDATSFARHLLTLGRTVVVSVPYRWPKHPPTRGHVHDPVDYAKLTRWMGREANFRQVVQEPFAREKGQRLLAVYDEDPNRRFDRSDVRRRRRSTADRSAPGREQPAASPAADAPSKT